MKLKRVVQFFIYCIGAAFCGVIGLGETSWNKTLQEDEDKKVTHEQ